LTDKAAIIRFYIKKVGFILIQTTKGFVPALLIALMVSWHINYCEAYSIEEKHA